jgi:hypothetical protein
MDSIQSISIHRTDEGDQHRFEVTVDGQGGSDDKTVHQVTMSTATFTRLTTGDNTPENVVGAAFRFLLEREPKESILAQFDVTDISRYFPEFERELPKYLPKTTKD